MTEGTDTVSSASAPLAIFGAVTTLLAVSGTLDATTSEYFTAHWPNLALVGGVAGVLFVAIRMMDKRTFPPIRQFAGQFLVTVIVSAGMPVVWFSFVSQESTPGSLALMAAVGGLFVWMLVAALDDWARRRYEDGSLLTIAWKTFAGVFTRFANAKIETTAHTPLPAGSEVKIEAAVTVTETTPASKSKLTAVPPKTTVTITEVTDAVPPARPPDPGRFPGATPGLP